MNSFPEKPTTKDLSGIPENQDFPAYHSSMQANNTVTNKNPHFAGQGTDSEATHDIIAKTMTDFGNSLDTPVLPGSKTSAPDLDVDEKGSGYTPSARTWKDC